MASLEDIRLHCICLLYIGFTVQCGLEDIRLHCICLLYIGFTVQCGLARRYQATLYMFVIHRFHCTVWPLEDIRLHCICLLYHCTVWPC